MNSRVLRSRRVRPRNRPGQGLVEFVLAAPILLILFFGLVEFAKAWNIRHVLTDAAREGTRILVMPPNDTTAARMAIETALAAAGLSYANADSVTYNSAHVTQGGDPASVITITYPHSLGTLGRLLGWTGAQTDLHITTRFVMRNQT